MRSMIKKVSKELIDFKLSTRRTSRNWYNFKIELDGTKYRAVTNKVVTYYVPDTKEYAYIDYLVNPQDAKLNEKAAEILTLPQNSTLILGDLFETELGGVRVITCNSLYEDGYGYDIKFLKNFPKKNRTYSIVMMGDAPMLVIRQEGKLLGGVCPRRCIK